MNFVQIGTRVINLQNIAYIIIESGADGSWTSASIYFISGPADKALHLSLRDADAESLRVFLNAPVA
jgi:hypothetical protein